MLSSVVSTFSTTTFIDGFNGLIVTFEPTANKLLALLYSGLAIKKSPVLISFANDTLSIVSPNLTLYFLTFGSSPYNKWDAKSTESVYIFSFMGIYTSL